MKTSTWADSSLGIFYSKGSRLSSRLQEAGSNLINPFGLISLSSYVQSRIISETLELLYSPWRGLQMTANSILQNHQDWKMWWYIPYGFFFFFFFFCVYAFPPEGALDPIEMVVL